MVRVYIVVQVKDIMNYSVYEREILMDNQDYLDENIIEVVASFYGSND